MAATTKDRHTERQPGELISYKQAASKIFKGTLVAANAAGYAEKATDVAAKRFLGVSAEMKDNSAGAAGDKEIGVEKTGAHSFVYGPNDATIALIGQEVFLMDDQTVTVAATTANYKVGRIVGVDSAGSVRVRINGYTS